ncbi:unnamed protein product, partial [Ectocarpus sp. 13 AM-2016]
RGNEHIPRPAGVIAHLRAVAALRDNGTTIGGVRQGAEPPGK